MNFWSWLCNFGETSVKNNEKTEEALWVTWEKNLEFLPKNYELFFEGFGIQISVTTEGV